MVSSEGRASLQKASTYLRQGQSAYDDNDEEIADHKFNVAETYLDIAQARGEKARVNKEIDDLKERQTEIRLAARERALKDREVELAEQKARARDAEMAAATYREQAETAQQKLASLEKELDEYEMKVTELGTTLGLQDVMFESDSATLKEGAINRISPLVNYLQARSDVRVRVEGHTDSTGSASYNKDLPQKRAEAVKTALIQRGIASGRIDAIGMGEETPIATNMNAAGRMENRRVEITLLNKKLGR